ncbi:uncharacterized protein LOC141915319 [Tubulanus polymorphus]|uniref:uncharacterized protein LOC141915319 n=1 Tax=Tubulanus polymorphus TaxID=672921 RepID=UPI003DA1F6C0
MADYHRFSICSENSIGTHISDLLLGDQPATLPQRFDHCSLPDEYIDKSFNEVFLKRKSDQSCSHEDLVSILNPENQRVLAEQGHYDHYPRLFRENVQKAINNREPVRKYLLAIRRGSTGSFYRLDPNLKSRATFFSSSFDIDSMDLNPHVPIFPLNVDSRFLSRSTNSAMNRLGVSPVRSGSQNLLHPGGHPALSPIAKTHLNDTNIKVRKSSPVGYKVSPIFVPVKNLFDKNKTRNEELTQSSPNTIAEMRKRDWENVLLGNTVQTLNLKVSEDKHEEYSSTDIEVEKFLIIEEGPNTEMEDKENENVVYPEGYWFNPSLSDDGTLIDLHSNTSPVPSDASTIAVNISELSTNTHDEIQAKVEAGIVQADVDELHQKRERFKSSRSSTNSTQLGSEFSSDTGDSDDVDVDEIFHMVHTRNLDYCKNDQEVLCNVFNDRNDVCPIDGEYQYYSRTNSESSDLPPDSSVDVSSCRIDDDSKLDPLSLKLDRTNEPISPLLPNERRELYFKYLEMDTNSHHLDTIDEESLSESSSGVSGYYDLTSAYENEQSVIPDFGLSESLGEMCSSELFNVDDKTSQNSDVISTDSEIVGRGLSKSFSGPADFHSKLTHYKQRSKSVGHQPLMRQKAVSSDEEEDESYLFTGDGLSNDSVSHNLVFDQDEIVDYDSNTVQHDDNFIDTRDLNTESYGNLCNIWNLNKGVGLRVTIEPLIRTKESDELKVSPDLPVCETDINDNNKQMPQFVNNLSLKDVNLVDFFVHKSTAFTENTDISDRIVDNEERCMKPVFTSPLHLVSLEPRSMKRANTDSNKTEEHFRDDCSPGTDQISSISVVCSQAGEVVSSERLDTISSDNTNHDFISLINTREMIQAPRTDLTREISENNFATCGKQDSFELEEIQSDRLSPVIHNRRGKLTQSNSLQSDSSGFADSDHGQIENESKAQSETESEQSEDHYFQRSRLSTTESVIYIPNSESSDIKMGNEFSNPDVEVIRDGSQGIYRSTGDMNATVIAWYEDKFGVGTKKDFDVNLSDGSGDTEVTRDDTNLTDEATVDMEIHAPAIPKDNQAVASDTIRKRKITDDFSAWYEDKFGTKPKTKDSEKEQEAFMKEEIIAWYEERFGVGSKKMEKVSKKTRDSSNTKEEAGFLESMFPWKFSRSISTDSNERGNKEIPKMAHDNPLSESDLRKIKIYRTSGDHLGQSHAENSDDELHQTDIKQPPVLTLSVEDRDTNCIRYDLTQPEKVNGNMTAEKSELLLDDDIIKPERAEVNNLSLLSADVNALSESSRDASFSRFRENGDDVDGGKLLNIINSSTDDEINEEISDEEAYVKFYIGSRQSSVCVVRPSKPIAADKELNAGTISKIDHKNDENELQQMVENVNVNLGVPRELEHGSVDQKDNDWKQAAVQSFAALMSDSEESDDEDDGISVSQSNNNNFEYKDIESENDDSSLICEGTTSVTETAPTFIMKDDDGSGCLNTNLEILNPDKPIKRTDLGFIPSGIVQKARKVFMGNLKSMRKPIEAGNGSKLEVQTIPDYTPQNMGKDRGRTSYNSTPELMKYRNPSDIAEPEITAEKSRYGIPEKWTPKDEETVKNNLENAANILSSELTDFPSKLPPVPVPELPPVDEEKILPKYRIRNQFADYLLESLEKKKSRADEPKLSEGIIKKLKSIVHKEIPIDDEIVSETVDDVNLSPEEKLNQSEEEHEDYDPAIEPIRYSNPSDIAEPEITAEKSRYGIPEKRISKDNETLRSDFENATKILSSELTDFPTKLEPSTDYSELPLVDEVKILPKYRIRNQFAGYLLESLEKKKSRTNEPKLSEGIIKKLKSIVRKKIPVDDEILSETVDEVNLSPEEKLNQSEEEHEDYDPAIEPTSYSNPSDIAEPEITAEISRYGIPEKRISKDNETLRNDFENAANILSSELTDFPSKLEPTADYSELPLVDEVKILPKYRIRNQFAGYLLQSLEKKKSRTNEPKLSEGIIKKLKSIVHKKIPIDDEILSETVDEVNLSPEEKLNQSEEEHEDYDPAIEPIRYSNPSDIAEPEITAEISRYGIPEKRIFKDNETLRNDFENAANILSSELTDFPTKLEPSTDYSELPLVDEVKILPKYRIRNQFAGYLLESLEKKKSRTDEPKLSKGIIKKLKSIVHKKIPVDDEIVSKTVHEVNSSPEEKLNQSEEEHEDYDPAIEPIRYSNPSDIAEPEITVEISRYGIPEKRISKDKETVKNNLENATKILSSKLTDYPSKLEPSTDYSDLTPVDEEMILPKYRIRNQFAGYLLEGMEKKKSRTDEPKISKGIIRKLKSIVHKKIPVDDEIVSKTVHEVNSSPEEKLNQSEEEHEDYDPAIEPISYSNPSDIAEPKITAEISRYGIPEKRIFKDNETLRNDFENATKILSSELTDFPTKLEPSTDYSELTPVDEEMILPKYRIRNQFAGYLLESLEKKKSRTDEPKLSKGIIKKLKSIVHKKIPVDDEIVSKTVDEVNLSPEEKLNQSEEEHEDYDPAIEPIRYSNPSDIAEPEITVEISRYGIPEKRIFKDNETLRNDFENAANILSSELTDFPSKLEPSTDYSELPPVDEVKILPKYRIRNQFAGYLLESLEKKKSRADEPKLSEGIIKKLKSIVRKKIPVDDEIVSKTVDEVNLSPEEKLNQSEEEHEDYDPAIEPISYSNPSDIAEPEITVEISRYGIPEKRTSKDEETVRNNLENAANILSSELTDFPTKLEPSTDYSELPPVDEEKILPKYRIRNQFAGYLLESLEKKKSREESQLSEGIMKKLKSIVQKKILVDDEIVSETVGVNLSPEENDCEEKISENDYAIEQITLANINDDTDLTKNHSSSSQTLVPTGDMDFKVVPGKPVSDHTSNEKNEENIREMKPKPDFIDRLLLKLRDEKSDTKPPEIEKPGLFDKFKAMVQKTFGDDDKQITEGKDKQQSSVNAVSNQVTDDMPSEGNIVEEQISISNVTAVNTSNSWINQADIHQTPRVDRNQYQASAKILVDDVIPVSTSSPYLTQDLEKPNERIQTPHHLSPIIPRIAKTLKFEKYRNTPEDSSYLCIQTDPKERSLPVMKLQTLEVELPNDWKGDECGSVISESDFIPAANDENTEEAVLYKTNVDLVIESDGIISPAKMSENREIGTQTDEFLSPLTGFGYQNWSPDSFTCGEKVFSFTVPQFNYSSIYNGSREETSSYKRSYVDLKVVPGPDGSSFVMLDDNQQKNPELDHYKDAYITLKKLCRTNNDSLTDSDTEKPFATSKNNQLVEDKKTRVYKDLDLLIHCVRKYKSDLLQTEKEASACYEKQIDIMCDQDLEELSQIRDIREQIRQQADQLEVELLQKKGRISEGRFYSLEDEIVNNLYLLNKLSELLKEQTHHREAVHDLQRRGSISMLSRIQ